MNVYRHVAITTREYHEGLMRWARKLLGDAGLENLEVYGQIPARGLTSSHLVFFPYRVGPEPKVQENAPGSSLMRPRVPLGEGHPFVPDVWIALGAALATAVEATFPDPRPANGAIPRDSDPYPRVEALPAPLRAWYEAAPEANGEPWALPSAQGPRARPPSLTWKQGLTAAARYIVLAHEPGRGTEERTSANAPLALSALNVVLSAVQLERNVDLLVPPIPVPDGLAELATALADARALAGDADGAERLRSALAAVQAPTRTQVTLVLIQDLNNREIIALMQALQRPLQTSLNLQVRYTLGSGPSFGPTSWVAVHSRNQGNRAVAREPVA